MIVTDCGVQRIERGWFSVDNDLVAFSNGIPKRLHAAMSQDAMKGPSANQRRCAHVHHRVYTLYSVQNQGDNSVTNSFCTKPGKYQDRQVGLGG
jgi:hypothetical protein